MDTNRFGQSVTDVSPEVQLSEDECSHIRGVQTAPVVPDENGERAEDLRPLAKVIPLHRVETSASVAVALFDDLEIQRMRKNGAVQERIEELWETLQVSPQPPGATSQGEKYQYYRSFVAALIQSVRAANDVYGDDIFPDMDLHALKFLNSFPPGTRAFDEAFRDLHKLLYLLQACERVAARNGF